MEDPIYKNASAESQNEGVSLRADREDLFKATSIVPIKDILPEMSESKENSEVIVKDECHEEINGYIDISCLTPDCEPVECSELTKQKTYSPTLIESALKVMKNLFSPDKAKSKSTSAVSPKNISKSGSESPSSSICISGKADFFALESEKEINSNAQFALGQNSFKSYLQNSELETVQTSLTLDPLNNTDESFMTTVSLIDDSFHSAVTHLDEHGDFLRNSCNLKDHILNDSRNLDLIDPYDAFENNESSLENTTLKLDNFSSDENSFANFSVLKQDEDAGNLNTAQTDEGNFHIDDIEKVSVIQVQDINCSMQNAKNLKSKVLKINVKQEALQDVDFQENLKTACPADFKNEIKSETKASQVADIFLNDSFLKLTPSKQNKIFTNNLGKSIIEETKVNVDVIKMDIDKNQNEINLDDSNDENICLENSISTTTVVLNAAESVDLENMLISLKADDSGTNMSSLTSSDGDDVICSLENLVPESNTNGPIASNLFPLTEQKTSYASEGNSSSRQEPITLELEKSNEFINHKMCSDIYEKKLNNDKSSLNFSILKHSEASQISKQSDKKFSQSFNQTNCAENVKNKVELPSDKSDSTAVISQESYTILTVHDKSLNRPVIEPLNISSEHPEKQSFLKDDPDSMTRTELGVLETCFINNTSNGSFVSEDLVNTYQVKQSTPLLEGHNEINTKFLRPTTLKLLSFENSDPVFDGTQTIENFEERNLLNKKAKSKFNANETIAEFSPVKPVDASEVIFLKSADNDGDKNCMILTSVKQNKLDGAKSLLNESKKSPDDAGETIIQKLNQTFHKKQLSHIPKDQHLLEKSVNSSFNRRLVEKLKSVSCSSKSLSLDSQTHTSEQSKLNVTYDVNTASPNSNSTFTKETKSPEISEANLTFDKSESSDPNLLNKTYDKPSNNQLNQTYCKKTESPECQNIKGNSYNKSKAPLLGELIKASNEILESPIRNKSDQTFVKDNICFGKADHESSETYETVQVKESQICGEPVELVSEEDNVWSEKNKTCEEKTDVFDVSQKPVLIKDQPHLNSSFPTIETFHCKTNDNLEFGCSNDANESSISTKSSNTSLFCSDISTVVFNEEDIPENRSIDNLSAKLEKIGINENTKGVSELCFPSIASLPKGVSFLSETVEKQNLQTEESLLCSLKDDKLKCDPDLVQLIQEQFSSNDIEKICSVVQDLSSVKLSNDILKASEQFDISFHGNPSDTEFKLQETESNNGKLINALSPQSFEFLNSIEGKPTGRDLSRESLYVKFDPLVQPSANSLIDFTKEGEALVAVDASSPASPHSSSICEQLLTISPQKKADAIVPPLTPLSHRVRTDSHENKFEKLKELQNEIYFLKNLYAERERTNKTKMEDYENQIAKLTGEGCLLEDKLKESNEREKSLVKKMKEQTQSIGQLKIIMEEYVKVISKLSSELETIKNENLRQLETLSLEKDSYMTHLQNTEAAFTDVHAKYEKSKKTIVSLKANETLFRSTITEQAQKLEEFKSRAREAQEKALVGFQKIQEELNETRASHTQETARLKAQLRKTELKVEALQESLDQKIKENQQLTSICDELIEGKK